MGHGAVTMGRGTWTWGSTCPSPTEKNTVRYCYTPTHRLPASNLETRPPLADGERRPKGVYTTCHLHIVAHSLTHSHPPTYNLSITPDLQVKSIVYHRVASPAAATTGFCLFHPSQDGRSGTVRLVKRIVQTFSHFRRSVTDGHA